MTQMKYKTWEKKLGTLCRRVKMLKKYLPTDEEKKRFFTNGFDPETTLERILLTGLIGGRKGVSE